MRLHAYEGFPFKDLFKMPGTLQKLSRLDALGQTGESLSVIVLSVVNLLLSFLHVRYILTLVV